MVENQYDRSLLRGPTRPVRAGNFPLRTNPPSVEAFFKYYGILC